MQCMLVGVIMLQITINETGTGTAMQEGNTSVNDYSRRIGPGGPDGRTWGS